MAVPPSSNVTKPASKATSQRAERSSPLLTSRPRHDVRGPEQGRVADPGDRTTAVPVLDQRTAEYVLTNPLHDQPFGFSRTRQASGFARELGERRVWQTGTKPVGAVKSVVEAALVGEAVDRETWPAHIHPPAELGDHAGVV